MYDPLPKSNILPRWAFCGWLLQQIPNQQAQSTCRLALIYDWLLFNDQRNNIMEIEPCILLMHHSRKSHIQMTYRLVKRFLISISRSNSNGTYNYEK